MSNSLSDQLLKAGLITQEQIAKADQDKQKQKEKARAKFKKKAQPSNPNNQAKNKPAKPKPAKKPNKEASDLAKFYNQRNQVEQAERTAEEKRKREAAERKRKTRKQIRQLITDNVKNAEDASIRFNFVVGETVKYLFVTEAQQKQIATGELCITFMDGKRCLIPVEVGDQILALDPDKVLVRFTEGDSAPDDFPVADNPDVATESTETDTTLAEDKTAGTDTGSTQAETKEATPQVTA